MVEESALEHYCKSVPAMPKATPEGSSSYALRLAITFEHSELKIVR